MAYNKASWVYNKPMRFGDICKTVGGHKDSHVSIKSIKDLPNRVKIKFRSESYFCYADFKNLNIFDFTSGKKKGNIYSHDDIITILKEELDIDKLYEDIKEF